MTETRACPICGSTGERDQLFRQVFSAVEGATPVDGYDVVVCRACGGAFADGIPTQAALDRYYAEASKYVYDQRDGAESEHDAQRLQGIAGIIARHVPAHDTRILDIGCATGRLLAELRALGFVNLEGLDPSPSCSAIALRRHGMHVRNLTLAELGDVGEQFGLAILVGVLEHLVDLDVSLEQIARVLEPGGLVYIEVPDVTAFADWPNAPYQDFSTEHLIFFSPSSLTTAMKRAGFSVVWLEQNARLQAHRTTMSNISAFFRRDTARQAPTHVIYDETSTAGIERYLRACDGEEKRLQERIDRLADGKQPMIVWGVGTHTTRLMSMSRLAEASIVAFIESNARFHGRTLHGVPILPPSALLGRQEPILISSRVFQQEIAEQVRAMGCTNELILLYDT